MNSTNSTISDDGDIFKRHPDILVFFVVSCSIMGVILIGVCIFRCVSDGDDGKSRSKRRVLPRKITNTVVWGVDNYQSKNLNFDTATASRKVKKLPEIRRVQVYYIVFYTYILFYLRYYFNLF